MPDYSEVVLQAVCPLCGASLQHLADAVPALDWRDDRERELGGNAYAQQRHLHEAHPVAPAVGDTVMYFYAWRGLVVGEGPLLVRDRDHVNLHANYEYHGHAPSTLLGVRYHLADPARPNWHSGMFWPSTGLPDHPITFKVLEAAPAGDLLSLLGDEWR